MPAGRKLSLLAVIAREWDRSVADLTAAIDSGKLAERNRVIAYYDRSTVYGQKGALDASIADLNEALKLDPNNAKALLQRGVTHFVEKSLD